MIDISRTAVIERIETAKSAIAEAQRSLASVIGDIETGQQRAEKRHVGEPLRMALDRLKVALNELAALEDLLAE